MFTLPPPLDYRLHNNREKRLCYVPVTLRPKYMATTHLAKCWVNKQMSLTRGGHHEFSGIEAESENTSHLKGIAS
jgi:hypothetical protein